MDIMKISKVLSFALCLGALALLSVACCGFGETQKRAKRSEAPTNLDGIRTAEKAYHAEWDVYTTCDWTPASIPGKDPKPFTGGGESAFENLGWIADGNVRCRYRVTNVTVGSGPTPDTFEAEAECDIDGNGEVSRYRATHDMKSMMETQNNVY